MTLNMYIATLAWLALTTGIAMRRYRWRHIPLMLLGIATDIFLVVYLQLTRDALQTAISFKLDLLPQLHILASSLALLLYLPTLWTGMLRALGRGSPRSDLWHLRYAVSAYTCRTIGFLLMFSLLFG